MKKIKTMIYIGEDYKEVELASKKIVCPRCKGEGTHVNPLIDGDGLTHEDMSDIGFARSYLRGTYDVNCHECKGLRVLDVVDEELLSKDEKIGYERVLREEHESEMEAYYESRWRC